MRKTEKEIIRYFLDELSPTEQDMLMNQLVHDDAHMAMFMDYEKIFDKTSQYKHKVDTQAALEKLNARICHTEVFIRQKQHHRYSWVIGFVVFAAFGIWLMMGLKKHPQKEFRQMVHSVQSHNGQKAVIMLADGTKVTLNSGSCFYYPDRFEGKIRMVKLQGEAFFEVARDERKPFYVITNGLLTRVLGTSFNIKSFPNTPATYITVATGHVAVEEFDGKNYKPVSDLLPEQQLRYDRINRSARIYNISSTDVIAWKENRLIFDNTPLPEIAASIERLYGVKVIYLEKTLAKTAFSARFNSNTSLAEVMHTLASTGQISYTIKDSVLHIKKQ